MTDTSGFPDPGQVTTKATTPVPQDVPVGVPLPPDLVVPPPDQAGQARAAIPRAAAAGVPPRAGAAGVTPRAAADEAAADDEAPTPGPTGEVWPDPGQDAARDDPRR